MLVMNNNGQVPEMKQRGCRLEVKYWRAQSKLIGLLLSAVIYLQSSLERVKFMMETLLERLLSVIDVSRNSSFRVNLSLHISGRETVKL